MIEAQKPPFSERRNELNGEKRIATRLVLHQGRQRETARPGVQLSVSAMSRPRSSWASGARLISLHKRSRVADSIERAQQRVRGIDLVVPVGADQQ